VANRKRKRGEAPAASRFKGRGRHRGFGSAFVSMPTWIAMCPCARSSAKAAKQGTAMTRQASSLLSQRSLLMLTAHLLISFSLDSKQQLKKLHYYHLFNLTRSPTLLIRPTSNSKWLEQSKVNNKGTCKLKT
jgi:hypothetical protein